MNTIPFVEILLTNTEFIHNVAYSIKKEFDKKEWTYIDNIPSKTKAVIIDIETEIEVKESVDAPDITHVYKICCIVQSVIEQSLINDSDTAIIVDANPDDFRFTCNNLIDDTDAEIYVSDTDLIYLMRNIKTTLQNYYPVFVD